jgi:hypothetical protein
MIDKWGSKIVITYSRGRLQRVRGTELALKRSSQFTDSTSPDVGCGQRCWGSIVLPLGPLFGHLRCHDRTRLSVARKGYQSLAASRSLHATVLRWLENLPFRLFPHRKSSHSSTSCSRTRTASSVRHSTCSTTAASALRAPSPYSGWRSRARP